MIPSLSTPPADRECNISALPPVPALGSWDWSGDKALVNTWIRYTCGDWSLFQDLWIPTLATKCKCDETWTLTSVPDCVNVSTTPIPPTTTTTTSTVSTTSTTTTSTTTTTTPTTTTTTEATTTVNDTISTTNDSLTPTGTTATTSDTTHDTASTQATSTETTSEGKLGLLTFDYIVGTMGIT
ncbi:integumentary mucin C.1-like [Penaeus japonicus]|uniref:integumentary mucin C.1-like n=1 Tax=Penaeus japonicus TaxID=27405 RepID=UPI001C710305|nr:integumentary mucin C.1-like [Penaeus japonicus]